jgi:drug/metabolite transporter (DMT)-like permease
MVYLLLPGLQRPDLAGSLLMIVSGIAWGVYSLRGRGATNPLGETAGNFIRAAALCLPLVVVAALRGHATATGLGLAVLSGAIASGFGYAIWYRVLPDLSTSLAGTVQLTVPPLAALGAVLFLAESLTLRLIVASACILGGVAVATLARRPEKS